MSLLLLNRFLRPATHHFAQIGNPSKRRKDRGFRNSSKIHKAAVFKASRWAKDAPHDHRTGGVHQDWQGKFGVITQILQGREQKSANLVYGRFRRLWKAT
jgi:hypothetical protein